MAPCFIMNGFKDILIVANETVFNVYFTREGNMRVKL